MTGEPVRNPVESIKLFSLCEAMKWAHLPWPGGLYDQHPDLLEQWRYIFSERAEYERAEQDKRDSAAKATSRNSRPSVPRGGRRR